MSEHCAWRMRHPLRFYQQPVAGGKACLKCGSPATAHAWFAKAY